jgi:hypothetical protein
MNATVYTYDQMLQLYREVMQKTGMPRPNWCRGGMGGMHDHGYGHGSHGHHGHGHGSHGHGGYGHHGHGG